MVVFNKVYSILNQIKQQQMGGCIVSFKLRVSIVPIVVCPILHPVCTDSGTFHILPAVRMCTVCLQLLGVSQFYTLPPHCLQTYLL